MDLAKALRVAQATRVAFVGAGGKTTGLFQLARSLHPPVAVTCSTQLGAWQADLADHHLVVSRPEDIERFAGQIEDVTLFTQAPGGDNHLPGLDADMLDALRGLAGELGFPVLVEADGSRQHPLKAPAEHEPVIPGWINMVVVVAGLSGLDQTLDSSSVHRPEGFAEISGTKMGERITEESIARMLAHPQGGLKNIPASAKKVALLNQADRPDLVNAGIRIGNKIEQAFDAAIVASLAEQKIWQVIEPAAGIILGGGGSSRYGQPKMLLPWRGKPLIRHVAEAALAGGLDPVIVVTGAVDQPVREALSGLPVVIAHNPDWQLGQSTSVRMGVRALPETTGGAVFLLADQPFATAGLLRDLVGRYRATLAPVTAPRVAGRRANPVRFDRDVFASLLSLEGDTGGRAIIERYPVEYLDWADENLLLDVDTPEDYARLKAME